MFDNNDTTIYELVSHRFNLIIKIVLQSYASIKSQELGLFLSSHD